MKKALGLLGVFVIFLVAVLAVLALFPPTGLAKRLVVGGTKHATGLDLAINGPISLRLVPSVDLTMDGVVVSNPAQGAAKPIVAAKTVRVVTGYGSLIGAVRTIDRITLVEPVVDVETDAKGRHSWDASTAVTRDRAAPQPAAFAVGQIEITDGSVAYRDQQSGLSARLERTQASLKDVTPAKLGEALVKAGAAVLRQPSSGTTLEVRDLDADARSIEPSRLGALTAGGALVRWRDAIQTAGVEASAAKLTVQSVGLEGAGALQFSSSGLTWRDPNGSATLSATKLEAAAKALKGGQLDAVTFTSGDIALAGTGGAKLTARNVAGAARTAGPDGLEALQVTSPGAVLEQPDAGTLTADNVAASATRAQVSRVEGLTLASSRIAVATAAAQPTRSGGAAASAPASAPALEIQQLSLSAPVVAAGTPIDATLASLHNKERVEGSVRLPSPEVLAAGTAIPARISLSSPRGKVDFDGQVETGSSPALKGRTLGETVSIEGLSQWLGFALPATLRGAANLSGDIEARGSRVAIANGRVVHGGNTVNGAVTIELGGERPKVTGKLAASKLDADAYLGLTPIASSTASAAPKPRPQIVEPEVDLSEVFRSYVRGMLDAPAKRSGTLTFPELTGDQMIPAARRAKPRPEGFAWSEEKLDLSGLRAIDLDLDWSVDSLKVRGIEVAAPQLRTQLEAGALTLEGREVGMRDGRITGRAIVDARQDVPAVSATVKGTGVDLRAVTDAFGIPAMVEGITSIDADIKTRGSSPKQLVQGLSGKVKSEMPQGNVIGYDFGNISLGVILRWLTGNREFDPDRKTPISGVKADLDIENGIVRDSTVTVGGPFLGVNAEGTIGLIEQRLDYRGRARIASFFNGLPFKLFGDWSRPSFQPDLGVASVFSRSAPGEPSIVDIVNAAEIKPDAELALMIGRVIQKAGPSGLDPVTEEFLMALQKRAIGN